MIDSIEKYKEWLKLKINYKEVDGFFEVSTPFVNHINVICRVNIKLRDL